MSDPVRRLRWPVDPYDAAANLTREWLVSNGLGGYASGTVAGAVTRRYHGLLVASLPPPLGRVVMLSHLAEQIRLRDGRRIEIGRRAHRGQAAAPRANPHLVEFRLESGLPVWRFQAGGVDLERRVFFSYAQNTVHVLYELLDGADVVELALRPSVHFRAQESPVSTPLGSPYTLRAIGDRAELALPSSGMPPLRLLVSGADATLVLKERRFHRVRYPMEERRGYESIGDLWSPGYYRLVLERGSAASLVASTDPFDIMTALTSPQALTAEVDRRRRLVAQADARVRTGIGAELTLAADQFIIRPVGRMDTAARASAAGGGARTVLAGYHWFTDWGRDTMISLEGLTLTTGRHAEARDILHWFAHHVRDGLIPNIFPEGERQGLYHAADATLWFVHALARYVAVTGEVGTLERLYPTLVEIVDAHERGTRFGIRVDQRDGLLTQGAPGYALTWMDAKVGDWVVTPRRGKAVEINALWYNALSLMAGWARERGDPRAVAFGRRAAQVHESFNARFWHPEGRFLYDVVDAEGGGNDARCRPNQVFAVSLPHAVADQRFWEPIVGTIRDRLLTPVGLRSLAPADPDFTPRYAGDRRARDAAYHQGTVWAWLAGPFVDAWLKVHPDDLSGARRVLEGVPAHLDDGCIGSIGEIFDATAPHTPRGCVAQAWSVAEVLRVVSRLP